MRKQKLNHGLQRWCEIHAISHFVHRSLYPAAHQELWILVQYGEGV
jgi:hypothetical protein